jgi:hypothetical protein
MQDQVSRTRLTSRYELPRLGSDVAITCPRLDMWDQSPSAAACSIGDQSWFSVFNPVMKETGFYRVPVLSAQGFPGDKCSQSEARV